MTSLILAAVLGQWSYSGMAADPSSPKVEIAKPSPKACANPDCNCPPGLCLCDPCKCKAPTVPVVPKLPNANVPTLPVVPAPQMPPKSAEKVRAVDDYGTTWEFDEKTKLDDWVAAINAGKKAREANAARGQTQGQTQAPAQPPVQSQTPMAPQYGYSRPQVPNIGMGGGSCGPSGCR